MHLLSEKKLFWLTSLSLSLLKGLGRDAGYRCGLEVDHVPGLPAHHHRLPARRALPRHRLRHQPVQPHPRRVKRHGGGPVAGAAAGAAVHPGGLPRAHLTAAGTELSADCSAKGTNGCWMTSAAFCWVANAAENRVVDPDPHGS